MKAGGKGGANTKTGTKYEQEISVESQLSKIKGYDISKNESGAGCLILYNNKLVARYFKKAEFYRFLAEKGIDWKLKISSRLLPDAAIIVIVRETLYIIEIKTQNVGGSVDEKLQTCDFKRKQYTKLVASLNLKVEYVYVFNDWFKEKRYKDVLDYINSVHCHYRFNKLPLAWMGLPAGASKD